MRWRLFGITCRPRLATKTHIVDPHKKAAAGRLSIFRRSRSVSGETLGHRAPTRATPAERAPVHDSTSLPMPPLFCRAISQLSQCDDNIHLLSIRPIFMGKNFHVDSVKKRIFSRKHGSVQASRSDKKKHVKNRVN
jgi:hypothetical protein